ncbi:iron complex transport system substrate-binding protein [Catenuloplanes nepalensis]|uniref:Iron complex transport system substrate-binding protein n=1 Tax=Catenuloplanes nepalensis TaxID=587533 RepID=A0ABT9MN00_9ACTN|nr:ABC transporter substrate-binding protein [Catenuloplanes nepalensis]MDP9792760.1 iron complex transport system substrate-binding protein [Catenuloplanes nepalensis]
MKTVVISVLAVTLGVAAGCARSESEAAPTASAAAVTSCGMPLTIAAPPQRALALEQNATEILLTLGLADRMAGTSYQTDPVLPELKAAYDAVPVLARLYPNREAVLAAKPDFIYSTFTSAFAADAAGPRADLQQLSVPAYLSRFACEDPAAGETAVGFDGILAEIEEIAGIFGVAEKGAQIVADQRARLAATAGAGSAGTDVLWYYSGTATPYVAGQNGLPAAISTHLGVTNAYGDAEQAWPAGSWEEIAQRNPDVIVLADLTRGGDGDSARSKRDFLKQNAVTKNLDAVRNDRFITVSGSSMDPSIRSITAAEQVAAGLKELGE